jgi:hypothetical protein
MARGKGVSGFRDARNEVQVLQYEGADKPLAL